MKLQLFVVLHRKSIESIEFPTICFKFIHSNLRNYKLRILSLYSSSLRNYKKDVKFHTFIYCISEAFNSAKVY